jgi:protein phosphatase
MGASDFIKKAIKATLQKTSDQVESLLTDVTQILKKELLLLSLPSTPLLFIGDTHGDWEATKAILHKFWETETTLVFLGDYVDRGPFQVENINLLYHLKIHAPKKLLLLRGNHESPNVNRRYGFYQEVESKLGNLQEAYWESFAHLPLACMNSKHGIFGVHGGLAENLVSIDQIKTLPREKEPQHPITFQLLWNDPREYIHGFGASMRGSQIRVFGRDVVEEFFAENKLKQIIRGHEVFHHGFHYFFDEKIVSLFSCRNYGQPIAGKVLLVQQNGEKEILPV